MHQTTEVVIDQEGKVQLKARIYGSLMAESKHVGRSMSILDGQIAAIARKNGYAIATRNIPDFKHCGATLINTFDVG